MSYMSYRKHLFQLSEKKSYALDKTHWTKLQHQQLAYANALEKLPAIWDICSPKYNDEVLVAKSTYELRVAHKSIFGLPYMASRDTIEKLYREMMLKSRETFIALSHEFREEVLTMSPDELQRVDYHRQANTFVDNYCSYARAMQFTFHADQLEKDSVDQMKGIMLIVHENGQESVRYLDGHIDDMATVPLCLIKLKLAEDHDRLDTYFEEKKRQLKTRLDWKMYLHEARRAIHCIELIQEMRDYQ